MTMIDIKSIVKKVSANPEQYAENHKKSVATTDPESARIVNLLFTELKAIYPAWKQAWPDRTAEDAAKTSWTKAFTAANLSNIQQIKYGVEHCRADGSPFMPSSGQFLQWCKPSPELLGLPSADKAYLQACAASHPTADVSLLHPAVYHAACETGLFLLGNQPESKSRPVFDRAYALTMDMVITGEVLREIPKALPEKPTMPINLEAGRAALAAIKNIRGKEQ